MHGGGVRGEGGGTTAEHPVADKVLPTAFWMSACVVLVLATAPGACAASATLQPRFFSALTPTPSSNNPRCP